MIRIQVSEVPGECHVCDMKRRDETGHETDYLCGIVHGLLLGNQTYCPEHAGTIVECVSDEGHPVALGTWVDKEGKVRQ